jgi:hypothetical protein
VLQAAVLALRVTAESNALCAALNQHVCFSVELRVGSGGLLSAVFGGSLRSSSVQVFVRAVLTEPPSLSTAAVPPGSDDRTVSSSAAPLPSSPSPKSLSNARRSPDGGAGVVLSRELKGLRASQTLFFCPFEQFMDSVFQMRDLYMQVCVLRLCLLCGRVCGWKWGCGRGRGWAVRVGRDECTRVVY